MENGVTKGKKSENGTTLHAREKEKKGTGEKDNILSITLLGKAKKGKPINFRKGGSSLKGGGTRATRQKGEGSHKKERSTFMKKKARRLREKEKARTHWGKKGGNMHCLLVKTNAFWKRKNTQSIVMLRGKRVLEPEENRKEKIFSVSVWRRDAG